jgi:hypothetical protein
METGIGTPFIKRLKYLYQVNINGIKQSMPIATTVIVYNVALYVL